MTSLQKSRTQIAVQSAVVVQRNAYLAGDTGLRLKLDDIT